MVVFGGGDWKPGDENWRLGVEVGKRVTRAGFQVVTGGYGGAMEAVSQGGNEAGSHPVGILHGPVEEHPPNPYIAEVVIADDYLDRLARLLRYPFAVALEGRSGTHAEIAVAAALAARESGRRLTIWAPFWRERLGQFIGEQPGVTWLDQLTDLDRWLEALPR